MSKSFFFGSGLAVAAFCVTAAVFAQAPQANVTPKTKTAAEQFKNIQVLKEIPAEELIPSMQFISASLGVECDYCHVERAFQKDDKKPKKIAREMMQMMFVINKNDFQGEREVTCNTCHRGSAHPQAIPAVMSESAPRPAAEAHGEDAANATPVQPGEAIMNAFIDAAGGKAALEQVKSRVEKGSASMGPGRQAPIEIYTEAPDHRVSVMHMGGGDSVTAFNGHEGWLLMAGRPVRMMSSGDGAAARLDALAFFPAQLASAFEELKTRPGTEEINGHAATVVIGKRNGEPPVRLYFDKSSGLLVRMVHYTDTALGLNPTQVDFADYRAVGAVKTPFRWTIARPSGAFTIQIDEAKDNVPIDAARFQKPAQQTAESGGEKSGH